MSCSGQFKMIAEVTRVSSRSSMNSGCLFVKGQDFRHIRLACIGRWHHFAPLCFRSPEMIFGNSIACKIKLEPDTFATLLDRLINNCQGTSDVSKPCSQRMGQFWHCTWGETFGLSTFESFTTG
eukprot:TRINITY_DN75829_c0_g1_i1.p1 TRINITY_DN75829_c0_g1~~TRINITY_DN75829_c0_g1_i1.p1  ORF type:complete len:124 (+),score=0.63 TRINITY_DN75829_c0_g1_i1:55-426(+)